MTSESTEVASIVEVARRWIDAIQSPDGTWRDFDIGLVGGRSHEWVTAYVCDAVNRWDASHGGDSGANGRAALRRAQRSDGGWSYNERIPSDADTTGLAVLALCRGETPFNRTASIDFLMASHDGENGGFRTYRSVGELAALYSDNPTARAPMSFEGWCSSHLEVTASALEALAALGRGLTKRSRTATAFLLRSQDAAGYWSGYWSTDFFYPTCRAVRALTRLGVGQEIRWAQLVDTLLTWQRADGSWTALGAEHGCAFRTGLALETLSYATVFCREAVERAVEWLRQEMTSDGHWTCREPFMRVPPPNVIQPDQYTGWGKAGSGTGSTYLDNRSILTSATVVSALAAAHSRLSETKG